MSYPGSVYHFIHIYFTYRLFCS